MTAPVAPSFPCIFCDDGPCARACPNPATFDPTPIENALGLHLSDDAPWSQPDTNVMRDIAVAAAEARHDPYRPLYAEKRCANCNFYRGQHIYMGQFDDIAGLSNDALMRCPAGTSGQLCFRASDG